MPELKTLYSEDDERLTPMCVVIQTGGGTYIFPGTLEDNSDRIGDLFTQEVESREMPISQAIEEGILLGADAINLPPRS